MLEPNEPRKGDPMSRPIRVFSAMAFLAVGAGVSPAQAGAGPVVNGWIAFRADRTGDSEIFVIRPDGSQPTNLTHNAGDDSAPAWSRDGTRVAFVSDRDGNAEIYVMNADGSG
jgi:dipeptidyl aminopeptidase/acylaminoacyl peptidase